MKKSASYQLGLQCGFFKEAEPSDELVAEAADKLGVSPRTVKAAYMAKLALGPLALAGGALALPLVGIPALQGVGRGVRRFFTDMTGADELPRGPRVPGGLSNTQKQDMHRGILNQATRNAEIDSLLAKIRTANRPVA